MALLVPVVLGDVVKVFTANDDGAVHLGGHDGAGQDTAADRDHAGEGALLVCRESPVNRCFLKPRNPPLPAGFPPQRGRSIIVVVAWNRSESIE